MDEKNHKKLTEVVCVRMCAFCVYLCVCVRVYMHLCLFSSFPEAKSHSGAQTGLKLVATLPSQPAERWLTAPSKSAWRNTAVWQCVQLLPSDTPDTFCLHLRVSLTLGFSSLRTRWIWLLKGSICWWSFPWLSLALTGKTEGEKGKLSELGKSLKPENLTGNKWLNLQTSAQI